MRTYTRVVFGVNAIYQIVVGAIFLASPVQAIGLYGFPASENASVAAHVAIRGLGGLILVTGLISVRIARNPDTDRVLLPVMGAVSVAAVVSWAAALAAHEAQVSQVALDLIVQALLLVAVLGYRRRVPAER